MHDRQGPLGVVGTFVVMLGAGVALDGDLVGCGTVIMLAGALCLLAARQ